jgi:hypothetical protein
MIIASHLEKIARLNDLRGRLDPIEDFELWFWSTMTAGTNAVNAALHHAGITPGESAFPSQPGVYYVPFAGQAESYRPVLKSIGDVLHVGRPPIAAPVPADISEMMREMEVIEHYRDPCTRGDMAINADIVGSCDKAFTTCLHLLERRLAEKKA